ncbi:MAG TPA: hypothetical protein VF364_03720 [Candidatus Limnocylindria bacterium]
MPRAAKPTRTDASAEPNKLIRQQAGTYRTPDQRFEVREADVGWFLVDSEQTNEFGQELIQGPYPTLKAVREALPEARAAKRTTPAPRPARKATKTAKGRAKEASPPPPPPSWIDQLPREEAAGVRRLIRALEKEGVTDGEALVRRDRDGMLPAVATRLIERRLDALVQDLPDGEQRAAKALLRRAAEVISAEGSTLTEPLPGWALVETGPEPEPPNRRIDLRG